MVSSFTTSSLAGYCCFGEKCLFSSVDPYFYLFASSSSFKEFIPYFFLVKHLVMHVVHFLITTSIHYIWALECNFDKPALTTSAISSYPAIFHSIWFFSDAHLIYLIFMIVLISALFMFHCSIFQPLFFQIIMVEVDQFVSNVSQSSSGCFLFLL